MKKYLIVLIWCAVICAACFSPWRGDEGTVTIRVGGESGRSGGRTADWLSDYDIEFLRHTIILEGPGPRQTQENIEYGKTVKFSVTPGRWNISVNAEKVTQDEEKESRFLIATGFANVVIKPGKNGNIDIPMQPLSDITITFEQIKDSEKPIIKKIRAPVETKIIKVNITLNYPDQYESIEWRIKGITGSGPTFILDLQNGSYLNDEGIYYLMVEVRKEGIPYSQTIIIDTGEEE